MQNQNSAFVDEVAAAEAELRAAQEKLAAAKARAAAAAQPQPQPQPQPQQPFGPSSGPGAQPFSAQAQPQQPYGYQQPSYASPAYSRPAYQEPYPATAGYSKDHVAAGLLAIFLGSLGIHKFYLGYNKAGFIMLALTVLGSFPTFGLAAAVMCIIAFIEGIIYLVKSQSDFERIYIFGHKEWF